MKNTAARLEKAERCGAGDAASAETALFGPEFHIDWCAFKLVSPTTFTRIGPAEGWSFTLTVEIGCRFLFGLTFALAKRHRVEDL